MLTPRLRERVPSAHFVSVASLRGYKLKFHKRSLDGSAKCNIVQATAADQVYGVVFHVSSEEKRKLDLAEGLGHGYHEETISVELPAGMRINAVAYVADTSAVDDTLAPYTWYRQHVVAGAREHGLPESYVDALAAVVSAQDPDQVREATQMALHVLAG